MLLSSLPSTNKEFLSLWNDNEYWCAIAREILEPYSLVSAELIRSKEGSNIVFQVGDDTYLKILDPSSRESYSSEVAGLHLFEGRLSIDTPKLLSHNTLPSADWAYVLMTKLDGELVSECFDDLTREEKIALMSDLGRTAREVHAIPITRTDWVPVEWHSLMKRNLDNLEKRHTKQKLPPHLLAQVSSFVVPRFEKVTQCEQHVLLTGEYTPFNIFVQGTSPNRRLSGMFDFGDLMIGCKLYDLLGPMTFMAAGDNELLRAFLLSYGLSENELNDELRETFMTLLLLHQFSNLNGQIRMDGWQEAQSFEELSKMVFPCSGTVPAPVGTAVHSTPCDKQDRL